MIGGVLFRGRKRRVVLLPTDSRADGQPQQEKRSTVVAAGFQKAMGTPRLHNRDFHAKICCRQLRAVVITALPILARGCDTASANLRPKDAAAEFARGATTLIVGSFPHVSVCPT